MRWRELIWGVLIVVMAAGCVRSGQQMTPSTPAVQRQETEPERILRQLKAQIEIVPALPPRSDWYVFVISLEEEEEIWHKVLEGYGAAPDPDAWVRLGQCQMRLGKYEAAVRSFHQALNTLPGDDTAKAGYQRASDLVRVAKAVEPQLGAGQQVVHIHELKVENQNPLWTVLSAEVSEGPYFGREFCDARVTVFGEADERLTRLWQSDELRGFRNDGGPWDDLQLYVLDLTDDGRDEVVVAEVHVGASWMPSHLDAFAWQRNELVRLFAVDSEVPAWVEDLNDDHRYEIGNEYAIGWSLCHAGQPRWQDVYAYKKGRYVLSNEDFPDEFEGWVDKLRGVLEQSPDDPEILKYLGIVHEIEGRPDEALAAYRRAQEACPVFRKEWGAAAAAVDVGGELKDIQARIRRLR